MARILIVDDSLMVRKTIRGILEKAGHTVVGESANGEQAIIDYAKHQPDLVTLDITMPGIGGIETVKRILKSSPATNIIIVSALGQKHVVFEALQNGAKNYFLKPINADKLLSVIELVLEQSRTAAGETGDGQLLSANDAVTADTLQCQIGGLDAEERSFAVKQTEEAYFITVSGDLTGEDFDALGDAVRDMLNCRPTCVDFTMTPDRNINPALFRRVINTLEGIAGAGVTLQITCYNDDYVTFFRTNAVLKAAKYQLIKRAEINQRALS